MEGEAGEFQDWEVLHNSDDRGVLNLSESAGSMRDLEGIEGESEGIIRSDYFSLGSQKKYARTVPEGDVSEGGSVESDNPSWIDPGPETRYSRKESTDFWSDSSSDWSDHRAIEFGANNELGIVENEKIQMGFKGIGEIEVDSVNYGKFWSDSSGLGAISPKLEGFETGSEIRAGDSAKSEVGSELLCKEESDGTHGHSVGKDDVATEAVKSGAEGGKKNVVWWKLPLEFLKYCVFRVSPVWTISVAAAVMGLVIVVRRLHRMKQKSRTLQLKLTVDDKKVSQFMTHAARLNEAFSVVRRVPTIRPSLPAAGLTPWPVMSLR